MYSRNQRGNMADDEYEEDLYGEEELYAYNLPPNYAGSRFRRNRPQRSRQRETAAAEEAPTPDISDSEKAIRKYPGKETSPIVNISEILSEKIGNEELLIIALIIILADEGCSADTVLFLILLLLVR